ncbi:MAG: HepT-like ribonuclease domain-containing protein [Planctomycetota bacterium]
MRPDCADAGYLWDMLKYARGVVSALRGVSYDSYLSDENLRLAIERRIEIIGEAARRISPEFQQAHPEFPWHSMIGQRNVLAHEYGEIEDERIWRVAVENIPRLIELLEPIVPSPEGESDS